jgi:hypothetical protein
MSLQVLHPGESFAAQFAAVLNPIHLEIKGLGP